MGGRRKRGRASRGALPSLPAWPEGWRLGTPDLVVTLPEPYALPADGPDVFRNFAVPIPIDTLKYVAGIEFRPGKPGVVHHANVRLDQTPASRERDGADALPGYDGALSPTARYPDGYFLGWTPGQLPPLAAKGMAWRLAPGTDLVLQLHLRASGKVEHVRPSVGFFFTADAPVRAPLALRLGRQNLEIAPGEHYVARDSYRLPVNVELHAIHPHAHYRAREIKAFADLPGGARRPLIHITDWDFDWQDVYRYVTPVVLPRGTTITMEYTFDNSAANRRNPDRPPRRILWGQNSSDEMADLWLQVLTPAAQDARGWWRTSCPRCWPRMRPATRCCSAADPANPALVQGKAATITISGASWRRSEGSPTRRGSSEKRWRCGRTHSETHNNLGVVLKAIGEPDQAIEEFRRAVALDPANADARRNLAAAIDQPDDSQYTCAGVVARLPPRLRIIAVLSSARGRRWCRNSPSSFLPTSVRPTSRPRTDPG